MPLTALEGMLMDVAPLHSQAIVIWAYNGFNGRCGIWRFELPERNIQLQLIDPVDLIFDLNEYENYYHFSFSPWHFHCDTLWQIVPEDFQQLRYIYIFSNPDEMHEAGSINDIDNLITRCLNKLSDYNVNSVSFIYIPATYDPDNRNAGAKQMIESITNWINQNNKDLNVYLVDRTNDFQPLLG